MLPQIFQKNKIKTHATFLSIAHIILDPTIEFMHNEMPCYHHYYCHLSLIHIVIIIRATLISIQEWEKKKDKCHPYIMKERGCNVMECM
jgi:hypothetical protein